MNRVYMKDALVRHAYWIKIGKSKDPKIEISWKTNEDGIIIDGMAIVYSYREGFSKYFFSNDLKQLERDAVDFLEGYLKDNGYDELDISYIKEKIHAD